MIGKLENVLATALRKYVATTLSLVTREIVQLKQAIKNVTDQTAHGVPPSPPLIPLFFELMIKLDHKYKTFYSDPSNWG